MANALPNLTKTQLAELSALLGEPPVLSSENAEDYNLMWQKLIECCMPADLMELLLVRQIQNETWTIIRLHRHQTGCGAALSRNQRVFGGASQGA